MDFIVSNGTWKLVDLPPRCTTIGCKWIFKKKLKPDGFVDKFKARLVAKDFKQNEGIDYFDTYSPVARLTTILVLIALASVYSLPIHQMDVKTTFFVNSRRKYTWISLNGLWLMATSAKFANLLSLSMDLNKHPNSGMKSLIKLFLRLASS
ncbi:UNVERIFIED_CONTAM: hypothetical protein Slati_2874400 [Sesamum latifolium]|uniref:Reverse transcriptase Ty1/copia-type domain-containing protein n=1 Tax=Sesamum latifolium TaxID=2727402 RepID=A0AAW2VC56_9LAMI